MHQILLTITDKTRERRNEKLNVDDKKKRFVFAEDINFANMKDSIFELLQPAFTILTDTRPIAGPFSRSGKVLQSIIIKGRDFKYPII